MFRFTIRDLLWLTVVVALAAEWWVEHREATSSKALVEFYQEAISRSGYVADGTYVGPMLIKGPADSPAP